MPANRPTSDNVYNGTAIQPAGDPASVGANLALVPTWVPWEQPMRQRLRRAATAAAATALPRAS